MENNIGINREMATGILQSIHLSLSSNAEERKIGENALANASKLPGFITTLFQLIVSEEMSDHYKQFLAVYLKNSIQKNWAPTKYDSKTDSKIKLPSAYSPDEQHLIRENLLAAILRSPPSIQAQLHLVFKYIAEGDYPEKWPSLVPSLKSLLTSQHLPSTETALIISRILYRKYEYSEKDRQVIYNLVEELFPILIQLFDFAYSNPNNQSFGLIFLYLCKIFYTVTHIELPPHLYDEKNMLNWMNLLMGLFTRPISVSEQPQGENSEKKKYVWWKIKKWTIKIFTRLFATYGDQANASDPHEALHNQFSARFHQVYAGNILNATLSVLAPIREKSFVPDIVITLCFQYITNSLRYASTYTTLKPNLQIFLQEILFPVLCFSEEDRETWEDDPVEFIRKEFDVIEEYYSPKKTAESLISRLFSTRNRSNLIIFLQFINSLLNRFAASPVEQRNYVEKDGALSVIGVLASNILDLPEFAENLENFIAGYVLPEFDSPAGFLRAKTCWAFGIYAPRLGDELVLKGLEKTIKCMMDGELPVRVNAAVSLRFFIPNDNARTFIGAHLGNIFELFLKLIREVENDELVATLESIITEFREEIGPYSSALVSSLIASFQRIISEADGDPEKDNCLAAMEILRAISIILEAIRARPELYFDLEKLITPLVISCMSDHYLEYFEDILKIVGYLSFFIPEIPRSMWSIVPKLFDAFDSFAFDFLPNIMVPLDNFISRSPQLFLEFNFTPQIISMFQKTMEHSSEAGCLIAACQLVEVLIQNFKGRIDNYIVGIFEITLAKMKMESDHISLSTILLNSMSNIMYYNVAMFFQLSEAHNATVYIFKCYFDLYPEFTRVYEHKLTIMALSSIFILPQIPPQILQSIDKIFSMILTLIERIKLIREKKASIDDDKDEIDTGDVHNLMKKVCGLTGSDEDIKYNDDDVNINLARAALLDDEDDDELEDEDEVTTFIDPIDEIAYFFDCITELKRINGPLFEQIILSLPNDSKINLQLLSEENERNKQRNH